MWSNQYFWRFSGDEVLILIQVIAIPETFGELISIASHHFQCEVAGISLEDGSDVSSIDLLR